MGVTFTALDINRDTADHTTPYSTASVIPTANQPVLIAVMTSVGSGTAPTPVLSGCGLTFTQLELQAGTRTFALYLGIGASPFTGAISIAGDGVATLTSAMWAVVQCAGVDTTTANGLVQSISFSGTAAASANVAFTNPINSANSAFAATQINAGSVSTPGTGWTDLGSTIVATPASGMDAMSAIPAVQDILSTSAPGTVRVAGCEMKAATSGNLNDVKAGSGNVSLAVGSSPVTSAFVGSTQVYP